MFSLGRLSHSLAGRVWGGVSSESLVFWAGLVQTSLPVWLGEFHPPSQEWKTFAQKPQRTLAGYLLVQGRGSLLSALGPRDFCVNYHLPPHPWHPDHFSSKRTNSFLLRCDSSAAAVFYVRELTSCLSERTCTVETVSVETHGYCSPFSFWSIAFLASILCLFSAKTFRFENTAFLPLILTPITFQNHKTGWRLTNLTEVGSENKRTDRILQTVTYRRGKACIWKQESFWVSLCAPGWCDLDRARSSKSGFTAYRMGPELAHTPPEVQWRSHM